MARVSWLLVALWWSHGALAAAQETAPSEVAELGSTDAEARANFEAGRVAFADARFADALPYFVRAHELSGRPELLYNIGICHDRLGNDAEALAAFEGYLTAIPEAENRAEVEQRIETARQRAARGTPSEDEPRSSVDFTGWILLGAGAVFLGAGVPLIAVGRSDVGAVEASMGTLSWTRANEAVTGADALTVVGVVSLGIGATLATVGLVMALTPPGAPAPSVALRVGPSSLSLSGTF